MRTWSQGSFSSVARTTSLQRGLTRSPVSVNRVEATRCYFPTGSLMGSDAGVGMVQLRVADVVRLSPLPCCYQELGLLIHVRRCRGRLYHCIKKMEPDFSQRGKVGGGEVMGTSCSAGNSQLDTRKNSFTTRVKLLFHLLEQETREGCGQSTHRDIQSLSKQSPDLALSRWVGKDYLQWSALSSVLWFCADSRSICETTLEALLGGTR